MKEKSLLRRLGFRRTEGLEPIPRAEDRDLGCYNHFYSEGTRYLDLLHVSRGAGKSDSIQILRHITAHEMWAKDTKRLLKNNNWRDQLPPLVSYILRQEQNEEISAVIWEKIELGSWITPQLVAGLHLCKEDLEFDANRIVKAGVKKRDCDSVVGHVESGPGNLSSRLGKFVNSIVGIGLREIIELSDEDISALISQDFDNASMISRSWYDNMLVVIDAAA
jgi:hypothetical protein